ncbi:uncharacterized protein BT62DRAFT_1010412 [Guyanagaster necrorhizus]|uniref:Uncharacterized protein n=1 Tax=Guyanagaster necrorhizus TaxID=856835 RepID=A0A9P7VKT5_9AGAR|nr:uncharacterized protein BT62DRAFT_1010412 [Guyanagaster necrorhizus MCA 3950]KAG7442457.1 hypothetical protein BT62DRAFT_1010412 [Guyanagaster necrorhizus MCA 3950]
MSLRDVVIGILRRQSITYTDEELEEWLKAYSTPRPLFKIDPSWIVGGTVTVRPHPQIPMMHYLDVEKIQVLEDTIGSSKRLCDTCHRYKSICEKQTGWKWIFSGSSRKKAHQDWMIPTVAESPTIFAAAFVEQAVNPIISSSVAEAYFAMSSRHGIWTGDRYRWTIPKSNLWHIESLHLCRRGDERTGALAMTDALTLFWSNGKEENAGDKGKMNRAKAREERPRGYGFGDYCDTAKAKGLNMNVGEGA